MLQFSVGEARGLRQHSLAHRLAQRRRALLCAADEPVALRWHRAVLKRGAPHKRPEARGDMLINTYAAARLTR